MTDTPYSGFHKKSVEERRALLSEQQGLNTAENQALEKGGLDLETANRMIENVIGLHSLPLGLATHFKVNDKNYLIPMAIEEPSVVAAASYAAKLALPTGFHATSTEPVMIGQIQLVNIPNPTKALASLEREKPKIIEYANTVDPMVLVKYGGGLRDMEFRTLKTKRGNCLLVHLLVDVRDAMGANAINTLAESLSPRLTALTQGEVRLRIISNLAVHRMARAEATWHQETLAESTKGTFSGKEVVERILDAWALAEADPYRAATHNKGIMNGIDAAVIATGNDWRAVEAGAHAYAGLKRYQSLTTYSKTKNGDLHGAIELPLAVATIGGATATHPNAKIARKIMGVQNAQELASVLAALGLAQNFAALRALSTEGIQKGHMRLHARNTAVMAGAIGEEIDQIAQQLADENKVRIDRATELLNELRRKKTSNAL